MKTNKKKTGRVRYTWGKHLEELMDLTNIHKTEIQSELIIHWNGADWLR